jgi:hypothetical protein
MQIKKSPGAPKGRPKALSQNIMRIIFDLMFLQERDKFSLKIVPAMMLLLFGDVTER